MRVEKRTNPTGCCPVDLMATIKSEEDEREGLDVSIAFVLTPLALNDLYLYKGSKKALYTDKGKSKKLSVEWLPSREEIRLETNRFKSLGCGNFFTVTYCYTDEIKCQLLKHVDVVYIIKGSM